MDRPAAELERRMMLSAALTMRARREVKMV